MEINNPQNCTFIEGITVSGNLTLNTHEIKDLVEESKEANGNLDADECREKLAVFIKDKEWLDKTICALQRCTSPKSYAQDIIYPLYEEEILRAEQIMKRPFIEATIPFCTQLKNATYERLYQSIHYYYKDTLCRVR